VGAKSSQKYPRSTYKVIRFHELEALDELHISGFYCLSSTLRLVRLDYEPVEAVTTVVPVLPVHTAKMSDVSWCEWSGQNHVSGMDEVLLSLVEDLMEVVFGRSFWQQNLRGVRTELGLQGSEP
jgi:hypothetical protein